MFDLRFLNGLVNPKGKFMGNKFLILSAVFVIGFSGCPDQNASQKQIDKIEGKAKIMRLENGCALFKITHMRFPINLDELLNPAPGMKNTEWAGPFAKEVDLNDPWGTPYKYLADEVNDKVIISSAGPDQQFSTDDDLSNAY